MANIKLTYNVYKGPSKDIAIAFLEKNPVNENYLYIVVETPEGTWARDINSIYREDV